MKPLLTLRHSSGADLTNRKMQKSTTAMKVTSLVQKLKLIAAAPIYRYLALLSPM